MSQVYFKPFVGKDYANGGIFGKKIMVLGESHYAPKNASQSLTNDVLNDFLSRGEAEHEGWMNTFTKFERALLGRVTNEADSQSIWQSVLFYNFLQVPMDGAREAGTAEDYASAEEPFFEVLNAYKPEYVIVWGGRLWDTLPATAWQDEASFSIEGSKVYQGAYVLNDGMKVRLLHVHHPSTGFDWDFWHQAIRTWLNL